MSANYSYMEEMSSPELLLPGFRFHPTEEELLDFYLKNIVLGKSLSFDIIGFLNIYHHDPWELPGLAKNDGEREWYFFVPIDRKHGSGGRPNRTTEKGYWKATGSDRKVVSLSNPKRVIGFRKTLVFYKGRAPKGTKTDWVMNEYRLPDNCQLRKEIVLCKVYRKATSLKVLEQRAAMEEEMKIIKSCCSSSTIDTLSFCSPQEDQLMTNVPTTILKKENGIEELGVTENKTDEIGIENIKGSSKPRQYLQIGMDCNLPEIQVPKFSMDFCNQDQFWAQLNSPWLQNLTPISNLLNF